MLDLNIDGAVLKSAALSDSEAISLGDCSNALSSAPGTRLYGNALVRKLVEKGSSAFDIVASILDGNVKPVRAILFDKSAEKNWSLGWHQDRTIAVKTRIETHGYGPWSIKSGFQHVEPPFEVFEQMITVRLHLDAVNGENAPLLIAKGSHLMGRIPTHMIEETVKKSEVHACVANSGDIWVYKTPILHASDAAVTPKRRRVLQVDYCNVSLPGDLDWLGI